MTVPIPPLVHRVGVVGCGTMGSGIAEVCARAGLNVRVLLSGRTSLAPAQARLARSFDHGVRKGRLTSDERDAALDRIQLTTDPAELGDREFVVEAIWESESAKLELLATLDKIVESEDTIIATNTSTIPVGRLARATSRPEQVIGTHFFSPVPMLPLVEVVSSLLTGEQTRARTVSLLEQVLGKHVIHAPDRAGFLVNSLLVPYLLAAVRAVESGHASAEVIDQGMVLGCAHPVGPLRLADLIGLDLLAAVAAALYEEFKEPLYAPPPGLLRMVDAGLLGKKSGRGFYAYS